MIYSSIQQSTIEIFFHLITWSSTHYQKINWQFHRLYFYNYKRNNDEKLLKYRLQRITMIFFFFQKFIKITSIDEFEFLIFFEFVELQNTSTFASTKNINHNNKWNFEKIEFFDFMYDEKSIVIEKFIMHVEKDIYFRDVNDFINRVKHITNVKNVELIRQNFYICFRNIVFSWYIIIFIENQKRLINFDNDVDEWIRVLHKRFKKFVDTIMNIINKKRYMINDIKRRREFSKYIHIVNKTTKFIVMNIYSQFWFIYNDLNTKFQRDVTKSIEYIDINVFLQKIKIKIKKYDEAWDLNIIAIINLIINLIDLQIIFVFLNNKIRIITIVLLIKIFRKKTMTVISTMFMHLSIINNRYVKRNILSFINTTILIIKIC